jgi:DNA-binding NarL/FixJ family response regulator
MKKGLRIGVASYHSIFLHSLHAWTASLAEVESLHTAQTPADVFRLLMQQPIHVLILDLAPTWPDALPLLRTLWQRYPALQVVLLLAEPTAHYLRQVMDAGVRVLLTKADDLAEYRQALAAAGSGRTYLSRQCLRELSPLGTAARWSANAGLTAREAQIVQCLVRQVSSEEIASELAISLYTVKTHRRNILRKLNVRNTIGLLRAAAEWNVSA